MAFVFQNIGFKKNRYDFSERGDSQLSFGTKASIKTVELFGCLTD
jgi:hypothetical protein